MVGKPHRQVIFSPRSGRCRGLMPYADPVKRRACKRDSERRRRAAWNEERKWEERQRNSARMRIRRGRGRPEDFHTARPLFKHRSVVPRGVHTPRRSSPRRGLLKGTPPHRSRGTTASNPPNPEQRGGRIAITWRGACVPWRVRGGKLRWLPGKLADEELEHRLDRKLTAWERERAKLARRGWALRGPTKKPPKLLWPNWTGPRWADGRPIVSKWVNRAPRDRTGDWRGGLEPFTTKRRNDADLQPRRESGPWLSQRRTSSRFDTSCAMR